MQRIPLSIGVLSLCSILCFTLSAAEPSWTAFNGVNHDNVSAETGLLKSWGENGPKLLWKADGIGNTEFPGYASVVISEGIIYTAGNVQIDGGVSSAVFALDEKTGKQLWTFNNGDGWNTKTLFPGERSTPTVDGKYLYALSSVGQLACLDAKTGKEIWKRNLREEYIAQLPQWAYAESPLVDDNKVIVWVGGTKASVVALDKLTGKTVWETPTEPLKEGGNEIGNYATMNVFDYQGIRFYINMTQKGMLAVDGKTGKRLFYHPYEVQHDINANTPRYIGDGKLLVISGNSKGAELLQLNVDSGKVSVKSLWQQQKFDCFHGGIIIKDGYVYGSAQRYRKMWICMNLADGSIAWEDRCVGDIGATSYADGMLYCVAETDGTVALVKATPEKYTEVSRFTLPEEGVGKFWAHPVICGKKLYLRHAQFLYCYDIAER
ncbi:polyvinylalcohol dehydrogenase [Planctomycetales bacterium]|nr:polyvinylalcohol dehydrogenase [Planctomycetales bacterium]